MEEFFQEYGEKIGFYLIEILGAVWVYFRTKKKMTPEEKKAAEIKKLEAQVNKEFEKAKADAKKLEEKKGVNTQ